MNLRMLAAAALLGLAAVASPAQASSVDNAHVLVITPNSVGSLVFFLDVPRTTAACATGGGGGGGTTGWAIDITTPSGQTLAATLMTALAAGLQVNIVGLGTCNVYGTVETAGFVAVHK